MAPPASLAFLLGLQTSASPPSDGLSHHLRILYCRAWEVHLLKGLRKTKHLPLFHHLGLLIWIQKCDLYLSLSLGVPNHLESLSSLPFSRSRGPKSLNFPDGNFQCAKTFRIKCVNHFRDKKMSKSFSQQKKSLRKFFL